MRQSGKTERMLRDVVDHVTDPAKTSNPVVVAHRMAYAYDLTARFLRILDEVGVEYVPVTRGCVRVNGRLVTFCGINFVERHLKGCRGWCPFFDNSVFDTATLRKTAIYQRIVARYHASEAIIE